MGKTRRRSRFQMRRCLRRGIMRPSSTVNLWGQVDEAGCLRRRWSRCRRSVDLLKQALDLYFLWPSHNFILFGRQSKLLFGRNHVLGYFTHSPIPLCSVSKCKWSQIPQIIALWCCDSVRGWLRSDVDARTRSGHISRGVLLGGIQSDQA